MSNQVVNVVIIKALFFSASQEDIIRKYDQKDFKGISEFKSG